MVHGVFLEESLKTDITLVLSTTIKHLCYLHIEIISLFGIIADICIEVVFMNIQHAQIKMSMANSIYPTKLANRERHNETFTQKNEQVTISKEGRWIYK